jgi:hypothetical protein
MTTAIFISAPSLSSFFPVQSSTPKTHQSDESSQEAKGYTLVLNSREFLCLGSRKVLPRLLGGLVATDKNLSGVSRKLCRENHISPFVHVLRMIVETDVKGPVSRNQEIERGTDQQREPKRFDRRNYENEIRECSDNTHLPSWTECDC